MPILDINDTGSYGVIRDIPPYELPPEALTSGTNVRVRDGSIERIGGRSQVFGTPGVAPHFVMAVSNSAQGYWLYTSLTKGYVYDGTSHINITRQTAGNDVNYTGSNTREWNGTLLGGVPILNNGIDAPQFWTAALSTGVKLADLTNWTAGSKARVMRAFGPYLVAFGLTDGATLYPHLVRWSHPADPGSVPSSWDVNDATKDAGQSDLPDVNAGVIVDALPLGDQMFVYKETSAWRMSLIGGSDIFSFNNFLTTAGLLSSRCVTITGDGTRHVMLTQDDVVVHNGNNSESVLDGRYKRYLFNQIDVSNFKNSFLFTNPLKNEVWICIPESGQTNPTRAFIWNYKEGSKGSITEAEINFRNAGIGNIDTPSTDTWSTVSGSWDSYSGPWSQTNRRKVVLCGTDATKLYQLDSGTTYDGSAFTATIQREGLSLIGKKRTGEWIVDFQIRKYVKRIWPKIDGAPVNIRVGMQDLVGGSIAWKTAVSFNPATMMYVDVDMSGRAVALEISTTVSADWRFNGFKIEVESEGMF